MGRPRVRPLLPSINRFLVGDAPGRGGSRSTTRGVLDMRRARPERVRGDPRPFPWQGGHRGRRCGPAPDSLREADASVPSAAAGQTVVNARVEDVPPRFHELMSSMVRAMVQWGVAAGVVTVVDGPNAVFRLQSQSSASPVNHSPPRPRPRVRTCGVSRRGNDRRHAAAAARKRRQRQHQRRR